jgi:hypothetical protein
MWQVIINDELDVPFFIKLELSLKKKHDKYTKSTCRTKVD